MNMRKSAISLLALTLLSANSYSQPIEEYCDFESVKGDRITISPMSLGNKSLSRERFGDPSVYPHFFYRYDEKHPVRERSIVHRNAVIDGSEFYRVNEGTYQHPKPVRYYTVTVEDCSKIYLRIDELAPEFHEYWLDRSGKQLTFQEFIETQGEKLSIAPDLVQKKLQGMINVWLTMAPLRNDDQWYLRDQNGMVIHPEPSRENRIKIKRIKRAPFVYMGNMVSPLSIEIEFEDGTAFWAPGHAHGLIPWEDHQGVPVSPGVSEGVVFANYGTPDRVLYFPVFESDSGDVIVEDDILKDRLASGSGYLTPKMRRADKVGSYKKLEFDLKEGTLEIIFSIDGRVRSINMHYRYIPNRS